MAQEVESKFRLKREMELEGGKKIKQGYLDLENENTIEEIERTFKGEEIDLGSIKEARVRQKGEGEKARFFFTLKSDGTLQREEFEAGITQEDFERL